MGAKEAYKPTEVGAKHPPPAHQGHQHRNIVENGDEEVRQGKVLDKS